MAQLQLTNQVPAEKTWQESIDIDLANLNPLSNWSIWRVPNNLLAVNKDAYGPHIISIGPLHHGEQSVVAMEVHKLHYMLSLLARTPDRAKSLDECGKAILSLDKHIRACYAEPIDKYSENDLAKMLVVDGCFILELFLRFSMADLRLQDDPVVKTTWMVSTLRRDLALLENQIPFFVLEWLFKLTVKPSAVGQTLPSLPELAFDFFEQASLGRGGWEFNKETLDVNRRTVPHLLGLIHNSYLPSSSRPDRIGRGGWEFNKETLDVNRRTVPHLLGLIHNSYLPSSSSPDRIGRGGWEFNKETLDVNRRTVPHLLGLIQNSYLPSSSRPDPRGLEFIHCASALHETGIEFERDETGNPFDLKFEKGVFKIPPLRIHDSTVSFFQNLIAYEQRCHGSQQYITSYFLLLDRLIDTPSDVELLVQRQILENDFGGWEDVSTFFNSICKQIGLQDFYYAGLCVKVNEYYKTPWYKYKADFKRNHCKNPWTIISLVAGFALLSLTALQTVYSVLAYYK